MLKLGDICPSCGFEFGFDDDSEGVSYEEYRAKWIAAGMPWRGMDADGDLKSRDWDPVLQLRKLG